MECFYFVVFVLWPNLRIWVLPPPLVFHLLFLSLIPPTLFLLSSPTKIKFPSSPYSSPFLPLCLQVEWSWASMQVDRDSDTGSTVSKTKGRKWSTGIRSHSKEPRAVTNRTRSHKKFMHTRTPTHTNTHTGRWLITETKWNSSKSKG